jgi:hypothetical protein
VIYFGELFLTLSILPNMVCISVRGLLHLPVKIVQVGKKHNHGFPDFKIGI